jgi:tRNA 2-thiocytidine biosynthesis protein TtcA
VRCWQEPTVKKYTPGILMQDNGKLISRLIGKTIFKYRMIEEGDRILVAVSGGKDSLTMLKDFVIRHKSFPIKFEFHAIHIKSDFCKCCDKKNISEIFEEWGAGYTVLDVGIIRRLKEGRQMNCYWCSMQRRIELLKFAKANGFNKIALGHHLDDIIETFFMNICFKGEVSSMLPVLQYDKYPIRIIRPLAEIKEELIKKYVAENEFTVFPCTCPYNVNSKRKEIRESIRLFTKGNDSIKYNIFKSINNVNMKYML